MRPSGETCPAALPQVTTQWFTDIHDTKRQTIFKVIILKHLCLIHLNKYNFCYFKCYLGISAGLFFELDRKIPKTRKPGDWDRNMRTSKKSWVLNPENPKIPGIGIWIWKSRENPKKIPKKIFSRFFTFEIGIFYRWMGYSDKNAILI